MLDFRTVASDTLQKHLFNLLRSFYNVAFLMNNVVFQYILLNKCTSKKRKGKKGKFRPRISHEGPEEVV